MERNEIVVFSWPADTVRRFFVKEKGVRKPIDKKSNYVKRCVGLPGDTLSIVDGFVHINGKQSILPDRAKTQYTFYAYNAKGVSQENSKKKDCAILIANTALRTLPKRPMMLYDLTFTVA